MLLWIALCAAPLHGSAAPRPFTVSESIAMMRLIDPDPGLRQFRDPEFKVSPDGRWVAIVTRRGDLATGRNAYALRLIDVDEARRFVNASEDAGLPRHDLITTFETSSPKHAIDGLTWLPDSRALAFVGRDETGLGRVYTVDLLTRKLRALTRADDDVATFDFNPERQVLLYSAYVTPDWRARNRHGYAVSSEYVGDLTAKDPKEAIAQEIHYFIADLARDSVLKVDLEPGTAPKCVSLSPNGRWAVILTQPKHPPAAWGNYRVLASVEHTRTDAMGAASSPDALRPEAFGRQSRWLSQFYLVDVGTGRARPLLNAPSRATGLVAAALWATDSARVIVAPTYLPLDVSDAGERDRRRRVPSIAEIDLASGTIARVTDLVSRSPGGRAVSLSRLAWLADGTLSLGQQEYQGTALPPQAFRKRRGAWHEVRDGSPPQARLNFSVVEDMNSPAEILAFDSMTGRRRVVSDLNPQLRDVTLGRVEVFEWQDRQGRDYVGGLVLPPDAVAGRRYPVVLQTYGFNPQEFLADGPNGMSTAFAARALANRGMLVLQMPEFAAREARPTGAAGYDTTGENPQFVAMMEAAIDALDARALIERDRVGLIGFSRTGMHVHYAITFSDYPIAAATVADSIAATPLSYAFVYGGYPGMLEWEASDFIGAPFWGDGIKLWLQRSPAFHLDRIRTPLRYEHLGTTVPAYWDTFALLKRHQRPVEMIHIPDASHRLETPFARHTSQQGNVDWFAFWLKDEIDADPAKAEQYARWRRLRSQREASVAERPVGGSPATSGASSQQPLDRGNRP